MFWGNSKNDGKPESIFAKKEQNGGATESPFTDGVHAAYNSDKYFASVLNVRARKHGRFSLIDRARGYESRSLDADGEDISLAESYADKYLDQRFMGGMYNVGLTDIYTDKRLYAAHFGLDTDGYIDPNDPNKGLDPFGELSFSAKNGSVDVSAQEKETEKKPASLFHVSNGENIIDDSSDSESQERKNLLFFREKKDENAHRLFGKNDSSEKRNEEGEVIANVHSFANEKNVGFPAYGENAVGSKTEGKENEKEAKDEESTSLPENGIQEMMDAVNEWKEGGFVFDEEEENVSAAKEVELDEKDKVFLSDLSRAVASGSFAAAAVQKKEEKNGETREKNAGKRSWEEPATKAETTGKIKSDAINNVTKENKTKTSDLPNFDKKRKEKEEIKSEFESNPDNIKSFDFMEYEREKNPEEMSVEELENLIKRIKNEEERIYRNTGITDTKKDELDFLEKIWIKKRMFFKGGNK